ncbi:MAG: APC family permease [Bacteroidota bacterium]|nr:APC family permease [Bacteroidota bacterium]
MVSRIPVRKRLRVLQLAAVIFFTVSGGPFGLEPLLGYAGAHGALLLLLVTPFIWDVPAILTVMELNSMMPVEGGYYQWVKKTLGLRFGFYEGWWTWLYTFVDLAIYPVLFVEYASFFFPQIAAVKVPVCLAVIWIGAFLNILGISPVGKTSIMLSILVITPFLVLFFIALKDTGHFSLPTPSLRGITFPSLGMALYTVMWNFFGWDNTTTYAGEVDKPADTYLKSTGIAFITVILVYVMVMYATLRFGINAQVLNDEGFPALGSLAGGRWLGGALSLAGMAGALGLYAAVLLSVSRVPQVMAGDKLLPAKIHTLHKRYKTPYISIVICAVVVSFMILWSFEQLIIIDVTLYGSGLFLEFITLIKLRITDPGRHRPFRIPLSTTGLCIMLVLPVIVFSIAVSGAFATEAGTFVPAVFALSALVSAEIGWQIILQWRKRMRKVNGE